MELVVALDVPPLPVLARGGLCYDFSSSNVTLGYQHNRRKTRERKLLLLSSLRTVLGFFGCHCLSMQLAMVFFPHCYYCFDVCSSSAIADSSVLIRIQLLESTSTLHVCVYKKTRKIVRRARTLLLRAAPSCPRPRRRKAIFCENAVLLCSAIDFLVVLPVKCDPRILPLQASPHPPPSSSSSSDRVHKSQEHLLAPKHCAISWPLPPLQPQERSHDEEERQTKEGPNNNRLSDPTHTIVQGTQGISSSCTIRCNVRTYVRKFISQEKPRPPVPSARESEENLST